MSNPPDRRSRKRLATRQNISNVATRLFMERGFDNVTVDEIAEAADVGRVTVFNHFPRKEDMFFDRDDEGRDLIRVALKSRDPGVSPTEALRLFAHRLVREEAPYVEFSVVSRRFFETVLASETLKARARAIRGELTRVVESAVSQGVDGDDADPAAYLFASLVLATWSAAFLHAHLVFQRTQDTHKANVTFLDLIDRGADGLKAAMAGTPYA